MTFPIPRIDDIDFEQLVAEAKARIPVHNPEWTHLNESDPGVTLIELFAFMTESLLYRANRIPERNRLKFLSMLGIGRQPATPARGLVTFDGTKGTLAAPIVGRGTELRAGAVPFVVEQALDVLPVEAVVCAKTASASPVDPADAEQFLDLFADFGPDSTDVFFYDTSRLEIPAGATEYRPVDLAETADGSLWVALLAPDADVVDSVRELIGGKTLQLGILPDVVDTARTLLPQGARRAEAEQRLTVSVPVGERLPDPPDPRVPRYRVLASSESADVLVEPGTIAVQLPASSELMLWENLDLVELGVGDFPPLLEEDEQNRVVTWLRLRRQGAESTGLDAGLGGSPGLRLAWVGVNAVAVTQRKSVSGERLLRGTGQPDQIGQLSNGPVFPETVQLTVDGVPWTQTDDLTAAPAEVSFTGGPGLDRALFETARFGSAATPQVYTCSPDGIIRFGTGLRGARPRNGADIRVSYDFGGGATGVVPAEAISSGVGLPSGVQVVNPIPTWGGSDAESLLDAEARIAEVVHHQNRLVTASDFLEIARRTPGVTMGRVEVLPLFHPAVPGVESPGVVTVMVIPATDPGQPEAPRPDRMFVDTVCDYLDRHRLVTTELHVQGPTYVPITVSVGFDAVPGTDVPPVREAITLAVNQFFSPLPSQTNTGWRLEKSVHPLEVLTEVARVPGVARVTGVEVAVRGIESADPVELTGLELPRLVGLSVQPGDPVPVASLGAGGVATETSSTVVLPIPAIPEDC